MGWFMDKLNAVITQGLIVEIRDHPDDISEFKGLTKGVDVIYALNEEECNSEAEIRKILNVRGEKINNVSKGSSEDDRKRKFSKLNTKKFLLILAKPFGNWDKNYEEIVVQVRIKPRGFINVPIELPAIQKNRNDRNENQDIPHKIARDFVNQLKSDGPPDDKSG